MQPQEACRATPRPVIPVGISPSGVAPATNASTAAIAWVVAKLLIYKWLGPLGPPGRRDCPASPAHLEKRLAYTPSSLYLSDVKHRGCPMFARRNTSE